MTIQMREGWVLCRDKTVDYAEPNNTDYRFTHPWRLRAHFVSVRDDGAWDIGRGNVEHSADVIELLDPWDERVPVEYRQPKPSSTSHGPQRGPADLSRIRAQVAQTRRDLADAIDSLRANLRVLDGVDAELNAEQASSTTNATTEGGA